MSSRGEVDLEVPLPHLHPPPPFLAGVGRTGSHAARLISNSLHVREKLSLTLLPPASVCWDYRPELPHVVYHVLGIEARPPAHPVEPHPQVTGFWLMLAETRGRQMRAGIRKDVSSRYKSVSHQLALSPGNTGGLQDSFLDLLLVPLMCLSLCVSFHTEVLLAS